MSARTVVGHDKEGRVVFVQADGKTGENGLVHYTTYIYTESFKLIKSQWSGNFYKFLEFWGTFLKTLLFHTLMYMNIFRGVLPVVGY